MTIFIASDHAGFEAKQRLIEKYKTQFEWKDLGAHSEERTDYPDHTDTLVKELLTHPEDGTAIGVLICGSGQGMAMRANKYQRIRAALCWDKESAQLARAHNNANILCLGGRLLTFERLCEAFEGFISTNFEGGRHTDRVRKVNAPASC